MPILPRRRAVAPTTTSGAGVGTTTVKGARRPSLFNRIMHPNTTPATGTGLRGTGTITGPSGSTATSTRTRRPLFQPRTKAAGPAPVSTHRRARTKPTLGSRIHGMAKRVAGTLTANRTKRTQGRAMETGYAPGSRRRRHL